MRGDLATRYGGVIMDTMKTKTFRGFLIYQVQGTNEFISLTENPSTHQVVSALKNAGFIKKGARYASFDILDWGIDMYPITVYKQGKFTFQLIPVAE